MCERRCESCGYAVWDRGDASVGMPASVEDCKAKFSSIDVQLDRMYEDDDYECPFHIQVYPAEWEKVRCTECNSPNSQFIQIVSPENYFKGNYRCGDCGKEFVADNRMW